MLTLKRKVLVWRLRRLVDKRNKAFFEGKYEKAIHYGELVDKYMVNAIELNREIF